MLDVALGCETALSREVSQCLCLSQCQSWR